MIPTNKTSTVITSGLSDTQAFTIATTGKAFRVLIDGLYSDKVLAPVRELMTNAADAHAAVGKSDVPFKVIIPLEADPVFGVRDYGEGMDHEMVMGLYTTLFGSSKENTNEQTGMLGLGSKSPFAYTDSFTVTCYDGTEQRMYAAYLQNDVPNLSLVDRSPSTEERGVLVSFPVQVKDMRLFKDAIQKVVVGFDTTPVWDGDTIKRPVIKSQEADWTLYQSDRFGLYGGNGGLAMLNIRQGSVVYPCPDLETKFSKYNQFLSNGALVIDVPIGTCDVATSRESLALDDATRSHAIDIFNSAFDSMAKEYLDGWKACVTDLEKAKWLSGKNFYLLDALDIPTSTPSLSLMPKGLSTEEKQDEIAKGTPGYLVKLARPGKYDTKVRFVTEYHNVSNYIFLLDNDPKVKLIRKGGRIQSKVSYQRDKVFLIPFKGQDTAVKRIKELWGAADHQFTKVEDIADPGPTSSGGSVGKQQARLGELRAAIDSGKPWCIRMRGNLEQNGLHFHEESESLKLSGVKADEVVYLTEKQAEKIAPDADQNVSVYLRKWAEGFIPALKTKAAEHSARQRVDRAIPYETLRHLVSALNLKAVALTPKEQEAFGVLYGHYYNMNNVYHALVASYKDDVVKEANALYASYKDRFPSLFPLTEAEVKQYIQDQITKEKSNS